MPAFRSFLIRHPFAIALLLTAALAMKLIVPAGFMPIRTAGTMVIAICNGVDTHSIAIDLQTGERNPADDRAQQPCSFSAWTPFDIPVADPWLLASAIAFILALGFAAVAWRSPTIFPQLLPPPRGPPSPF